MRQMIWWIVRYTVCADLQHVLGSLCWPSIDGEGVLLVINRSPVLDICLEGSLDLPILDLIDL